VRGEKQADPLLAHAMLLRLKMAAALAILDYRYSIDVDDWRLAEMMQACSDATMQTVFADLRADAARQEQATSKRLARREVEKDIALTNHKMIETAEIVWEKVRKSPGMTRRDLHLAMPRRREWLVEAIDYLIDNGRMEERAEEGQGTDKRALYAGSRLGVVRVDPIYGSSREQS
jgi:hypothetical protein